MIISPIKLRWYDPSFSLMTLSQVAFAYWIAFLLNEAQMYTVSFSFCALFGTYTMISTSLLQILYSRLYVHESANTMLDSNHLLRCISSKSEVMKHGKLSALTCASFFLWFYCWSYMGALGSTLGVSIELAILVCFLPSPKNQMFERFISDPTNTPSLSFHQRFRSLPRLVRILCLCSILLLLFGVCVLDPTQLNSHMKKRNSNLVVAHDPEVVTEIEKVSLPGLEVSTTNLHGSHKQYIPDRVVSALIGSAYLSLASLCDVLKSNHQKPVHTSNEVIHTPTYSILSSLVMLLTYCVSRLGVLLQHRDFDWAFIIGLFHDNSTWMHAKLIALAFLYSICFYNGPFVLTEKRKGREDGYFTRYWKRCLIFLLGEEGTASGYSLKVFTAGTASVMMYFSICYPSESDINRKVSCNSQSTCAVSPMHHDFSTSAKVYVIYVCFTWLIIISITRYLTTSVEKSEQENDCREKKKQKSSTRLKWYLAITVLFMFVEFVYGISTNSLGLISDAVHMLIDSISIIIGLVALSLSKLPATNEHPFGFARYEVLSGFTNGVFLIMIAIFLVIESLSRMRNPPVVDATWLFFVSSLGCLVNLVGVIFFHDAHCHGHSHARNHEHSHTHGHSHSHAHNHGHGHSQQTYECKHTSHVRNEMCESIENGNSEAKHVDQNLRGVYLHILADLLGSFSVMVSTLIVRWTGWMGADPICSLFTSALMILAAWPLVCDTGKSLLENPVL